MFYHVTYRASVVASNGAEGAQTNASKCLRRSDYPTAAQKSSERYGTASLPQPHSGRRGKRVLFLAANVAWRLAQSDAFGTRCWTYYQSEGTARKLHRIENNACKTKNAHALFKGTEP